MPGRDRRASADEVLEVSRNWTRQILECRTYGHVWRPQTARKHPTDGYYAITQVCERCTSQRHQEMSLRGSVFATWINYCEGYLSHGLGRVSGDARDILRIETITRTFNVTTARKADHEQPHSSRTAKALGLERKIGRD